MLLSKDLKFKSEASMAYKMCFCCAHECLSLLHRLISFCKLMLTHIQKKHITLSAYSQNIPCVFLSFCKWLSLSWHGDQTLYDISNAQIPVIFARRFLFLHFYETVRFDFYACYGFFLHFRLILPMYSLRMISREWLISADFQSRKLGIVRLSCRLL